MTRRLALTATLILGASLPAHSWEAGVDGALCTLEHEADAGAVRLTYDPSLPLYSISITRSEPWPDAAVFAIRFEGARAITISTTRHVLSAEGRTLTVTDRGFGNVLAGLEGNGAAIAIAGDAALSFDLSGAAPEVAAFRACLAAPSA